MSNLFNVDDIPREQETVAPLKLPASHIPPEREFKNNTKPKRGDEESSNKNVIYAIMFLGAVILLLMLPDKIETPKSTPSVVVPTKTTKSKKPLDDAGEILGGKFNTTKELEWVNYTKSVYKNSQVASFVIECESPMLGEFEMMVTKDVYTTLNERGILPLMIDYNVEDSTSNTYYDNPRLHGNWEELLKGETGQ